MGKDPFTGKVIGYVCDTGLVINVKRLKGGIQRFKI